MPGSPDSVLAGTGRCIANAARRCPYLRSAEKTGESFMTIRLGRMPVVCRALLSIALICSAAPARVNVITDWDIKALAVATPNAPGQRELAMVHVAMFDAVNAIERRYRPYLVQPAVPG